MNNKKLEILSTDSNVTKNVKKYGDPYMKAPLAKLGKWLLKHRLFTN